MSGAGRHWEEILDADRDNLIIPRRLTWEFGERARERLNATEEFLDRDYFAPAYEKADSAKPKHEKMLDGVDSLLPLMATAVVVPYDEAEHRSMPVAIAVPASPARTHVDSETESVDSGATIPPSPLTAEQYDSEEL